ncbi:hypothetical protein BAG01nite_43860 [Brevibacillus agri]|uniref:Uncharacterized protein n=1 Tax=Brevibacillus agri TaxID=51101 RepID=A0ABQ0SWG9_9BACL|nr:hypothetical protein BAG01nite_43860 [Brevibacillus agri]
MVNPIDGDFRKAKKTDRQPGCPQATADAKQADVLVRFLPDVKMLVGADCAAKDSDLPTVPTIPQLAVAPARLIR